ncbi:MAG: ATP-binding protein [Kiritimatiellae bacterium]|nr:ATP-binding protein [Kiritimatiellia bacterium]
MKRDFEKTLAEWNSKTIRKPLVIRGMRQTGKTWCVRKFASEFYKDRFLEVNFEFSGRWAPVFDGDLNPDRICDELELLSGRHIRGGGTLLFLDEIQLCPKALASLRYFRERMPEMPVVAAGSLLDFALDDIQFPVGRVQFAELNPMSFAEYLDATGNAPLAALLKETPRKLPAAVHLKLLDEVRAYSIVGGLPECVKAKSDGAGLLDIRELQNDLITAFEQDFSKYPERMDASILREIWRAANASSGRQIAYAALSRDHAGSTNRKALDLLSKARLVRISQAASSSALPFDISTAPRIKPFAGDIGLYQAMSGRPADETLRECDLLAVYNGALAEQFVAQELAASFGGSEPHWWKRDAKNSQAEIDFLVALDGRALPIEVKGGAAGRLKSLHQFLKETPESPDAVVLSSAPFGEIQDQRLRFLPIYYAGSLRSA